MSIIHLFTAALEVGSTAGSSSSLLQLESDTPIIENSRMFLKRESFISFTLYQQSNEEIGLMLPKWDNMIRIKKKFRRKRREFYYPAELHFRILKPDRDISGVNHGCGLPSG